MNVLLIQLPIPKLNFGLKTGNIPLGAACLKQACDKLSEINVEIIPESIVSYLGDSALINFINDKSPDLVGFTTFAWNIERSLYIAEILKSRLNTIIVFGGPEITPDNNLAKAPFVDHYIYGEGESVFTNLLRTLSGTSLKMQNCKKSIAFVTSSSPYVSNLLEPGIENLMLLESQRGCPYQCGFCYYNKSRSNLVFKDSDRVIEGIQWAIDQKIEELYILDPSLNVRPDLKDLLRKISEINKDRRLSINSEIRAEWIDTELADLFAMAGFTWFEIGLQSTNKKALEVMKRPTDLSRFLNGVKLLKERDIQPRIDLISGLPKDDLQGFSQSLGFVAENNLDDDIQVFPLSILPGTEFRLNSNALHINYEPKPPYTIIETNTFSKEDMLLSFDYAESLFDINLFPFPHLDISWKCMNKNKDELKVVIGENKYTNRVIIDSILSNDELNFIADNLSLPYQIIVKADVSDQDYICNVLNILTIKNKFSPLEIIFIQPVKPPSTEILLKSCKIKRPHFLDIDMRFLFSHEGNRAVLFTIISESSHYYFTGDMKRQVFLWKKQSMPEERNFNDLSEFDGILVDNNASSDIILKWQNEYSKKANEHIPVSFADSFYQSRWLKLTASDEFYFHSDTIEINKA